MRAVRLHEIGQQFQVDQVPDPVAPSGGAVVRLETAALNHRDEFIRMGLYAKIQLPAILGSDGAGVVESVGPGVDSSWVGRKVVVNPSEGWGTDPRAQDLKTFFIRGMPKQGTFAERIALPLDRLEPMPEHLSWPEAAALPLAGVTAYRALVTRGEVKRGDHVLVTGVGGGVATVAMQLAQALGAQVSVTSGSEVSYKQKGWEKELVQQAGGPPSLVIDSAGGPDFGALLNAVAPGGRIVSYGATRGPAEKLELTRVFFKQIDLRGTTMGTDEEFRAMLLLVARERVRPLVDHVFPLSQAAEADRRMAQGEQMGKIVLNCRA